MANNKPITEAGAVSAEGKTLAASITDGAVYAFKKAQEDGFQLGDLLATIEGAAKGAVQWAFDQLPEADGLTRKEAALKVLMGLWDKLTGAARDLLVATLGQWMGFAFDLARGWIESAKDKFFEVVEGWLDALLKWAYEDIRTGQRLQALAASV